MRKESTILFTQYNNYFNRIVKRSNSVDSYRTADFFFEIPHINWNENDGIETEAIFNWNQTWNPDYCVELDEDNNIVSRWFVMEQVRTRGFQYRFKFKRDLLADYYENVLGATTFIQKGYVSEPSPLLFNSENFKCNQIKQSETLIQDSTHTSWMVVYYDKSKINELTGSVVLNQNLDVIATVPDNFEDWELFKYTQTPFEKIETFGYVTEARREDTLNVRVFRTDSNSGNTQDLRTYLGQTSLKFRLVASADLAKETLTNSFSPILTTLNPLALDMIEDPDFSFDDLEEYKGLVQFNDGVYEIRLVPEGRVNRYKSIATTDSIYTYLSNALKEDGMLKIPFFGTISDETFSIHSTRTKYRIIANKVPTTSISYDFTGSHNFVTDQPYGILALPYSVDLITTLKIWSKNNFSTDGTSLNKINYEISKSIVADLIKRGSGTNGFIYDVQLIPFCPLQTIIGDTKLRVQPRLYSDFYLNLSGLTNNKSYTLVNDGDNNPICFAIYPTSCKFTNNIQVNLTNENITNNSSKDAKIENECTFYRLCSPNFNGIYEFNVAKNGGSVEYFNFDVTLKPYQPYIHVNPNFKGLYGSDYNDPRGLVCGGDFSITQLSSAWETYQRQNSNYDRIFDRQIENMETMNSITKTQALVGVASGAITGAGAGAVAGMSGGPTGAAIGAITGGALSVGAGMLDYSLLKQQQSEQVDYAKDMHNFQLQNIKALPNSLTKVDAFNNNNKVFIVLEKYSCTDEEKNIFIEKLTYEGMTINAIDTISNYLDYNGGRTFIKGQIIRLYEEYETGKICQDYHLANQIYNEIAKGVYF